MRNGYQRGTGLGRSGFGIAVPLPIHQQAGNSKHGLGHLGRDSEGKKILAQQEKSEQQLAKAETKKRKRESEEGSEKKTNVFDFMNKRLNQPQKKVEQPAQKNLTQADIQKILREKKESISKLQSYIQKQETAYERNRQRDPALAQAILVKLSQAQIEMRSLKAGETEYQTRLELKTERKKLRTF